MERNQFMVKIDDHEVLSHQENLPSPIICIMGAPGTGKTTLAQKLETDPEFEPYNLCHIPVGDYLRELDSKGWLSPCASNVLRVDSLIRGEKLVVYLREQLRKVTREGHGIIILDNYPRSIDQLISHCKAFGVPVVGITLECSKEEALKRFMARARPREDELLFTQRWGEQEMHSIILRPYFQECGRDLAVSTNVSIDEAYGEMKRLLKSHPLASKLFAPVPEVPGSLKEGEKKEAEAEAKPRTPGGLLPPFEYRKGFRF